MSWRNPSTMKIATLLKTMSSNMSLARCSLPTRRHSSALIYMLESAAAAPPTGSKDFNATIPSNKSTPSGQPASSDEPRPSSIWGPITDHLSAAKRQARADALAQSNEPPEDVWKRRSEFISTQLRVESVTNVRASVSAKARRAMGASAYDFTGANEAEVPFVASGRTVTSGDFGRAIIKLNQILQRNKVRQEWRRDKYFTKPFQLRYRLRSRRHRQRFAAAIRRKVQIVQAIKRRGM